jgi:hypothetical protein
MSESEAPPGDGDRAGRQESSKTHPLEPCQVEARLASAIERLTAIESYLMTLVHEDSIKYALLILAASRCRAAKDAIKSHLEPDPPRKEKFWWNRDA